MSTYSPQTLGWWMDERRGELGLTWQDVADEAGVSTETLYRIADGRGMRTTTKKGLERALRWRRGSVDAVLRGDTPTADDDPGELPVDPAPLRVPLEDATPGDLRRALAWWHRRLNSREDFGYLLYLLELSAQLEDRPNATQGGLQADA